jgi:beta-galactosidase
MPSRLRTAAFTIACAVFLPTAFAAEVRITSERRINFDDDWRFFKGSAEGAELPSFDDSKWRALRLPHDWAIEGPFDPKANPHTGALPIFGTGWYRKSFTLPAAAKGKYFWIEFDGAMNNSTVWINGQQLGGRPYGYIGFGFDLTPYLKFGGEPNVVAVRLTPEDRSSRWYPGAGIYRNVWLDVTAAEHVARWGTYVTTPQVSAEAATVNIKTEIRNQAKDPAQLILQSIVLAPNGKEAGRSSASVTVAADGTQSVNGSIGLKNPDRWDIDHPAMYTLVSEVLKGKQVVDRYTTPFGVRSIAFDKAKGFLINGRVVKIQGVCNHHDLGALGAAVSRRATERQLEIMKGAGVNAIRTSHNPPSPELLELCDRMGLLVMDESFDMWRIPKVPNGYSKYFDQWSERDLRDMVDRDRNHPSIIMYSIGNEIPEQGRADGWVEAKRLTGLFHQEDPTRPTTSAFNNWANAIKNKIADEVDIPGMNYAPNHYEEVLKDHPNWVVYGSETASCVSSRGVYHLPIQKYEKHPSLELTSYDIIAPSWAYCPDVEFTYQDKLPQVLGEFVWTGFDYIGEPTPYFAGRNDNTTDWPARSSYFGMVDLAGFPKDRYYLYQSQWTKTPMVHVLPHWNWAGREGQPIPVMAYTNADEVELFLNGKSLGRKKRFSDTWDMPVNARISRDLKFQTKYRLIWQVPYAPGELKAVAYKDGKQVASDVVKTASAAARIRMTPDRATIASNGDDLSFITVRIEDNGGTMVPEAANLVQFHVTGPGVIAAVDNGKAADDEPFQADHRKAFNGLALLVIRAQPGQAGKIHITATSEGLAQATVDVTAQKGK